MESITRKRLWQLMCTLLLQLSGMPVALSETFRDSPASTTALTHHPLTLSCYAPDPTPPPSVIWLHNEERQTSDGRRNVSYDPDTGRSEYQLSEVAYSDAGQYQCQALSEAGDFLSDMGTVTVQGQPAFTQPLSPIIVPLGSQAVFQCRVITNPPANISWTFGNPPVGLNNGGRFFLNQSTLTISNVQSSDEGYYHCVASNVFGANSTSASLSIGDPPPAVELTISPNGSPLSVLGGSDVTLHCSVAEETVVDTLQWLRNGTNLSNIVTRESNGLALSLDNITKEQDGVEYSCVASSTDGSIVTATVLLEVLIPPTVGEISDILVVNYNLTSPPQCIASGNPLPTITWLGPDGEPLDMTDGVPVIEPLTRSSSGVYICVATNSVGEERSEFTLIVEDAPVISVPPSDTLAAYGSDVILNCVAEGIPPPDIVWYRVDGGNLSNSSVVVGGALHLFNVAEEDSGEYNCTASNRYFPPAVEEAMLTVLGPPRVTSLSALPSPVLLTGTDFSLQCNVSGPPSNLAPISISWYQDGTLLVPSGDPRIQITESGMLTVYGADEGYSGVYTCNASTGYAFDTAHVTVTVGYVPVVTMPPSDVDLKPGQGTFIDCAVSGLPRPRIEWYMTNETDSESQLITTVGEHYVIHTDGLELRSITQQHSGTYECEASNDLGNDTRSARVRVEGPALPLSFSPSPPGPALPFSVSPIVLIADDNYTLTCDVIYNFPMATVSWRRADRVTLPPERFLTNSEGVLEISPVAPGDDGFYECVATNEYGESVVAGNVTVYVRPTVSLPSSSITAILDTTATLPCTVDGRPPPTQNWTLNTGSSPSSGSRYIFMNDTGDLVITNVEPSDTGDYTCTASNPLGVVSDVVEVVVRGAPITDLIAEVVNSTAVTLSWSPPPPHLTTSLITYHIEYGRSGSSQRETLVRSDLFNLVEPFVGLDEATQYQFSVYGVYREGVMGVEVRGVEVMVTATTDEDIPTVAPQNVSLDGKVEALDISWLPPPEAERNGLIIRYDIYYRRMEEEEEGEELNFEPRAFTKAEHTPFDPLAATHSARLAGLRGGRRYEVVIGAATAVGVGPNSTLVSGETLEPFPLVLVLAIAIPAGTIVLLLFLLVLMCVCYRCFRKTRIGKHSPLMEQTAHSEQQRRLRKKEKRGERVISGPVPGIPPNIDTTVPGKFTMQTKDGALLSTDPKVIMPEDVAPPPGIGDTVRQVPYDEVLTSLKKRTMEDDPYEEISMDGPPTVSTFHPNGLPPEYGPHVRVNPFYMPDSQEDMTASEQGNPSYDRLTHSDEQVAPSGHRVGPNVHRKQPNISIMLQGGSLPHVAHTQPFMESAGLRDKSQSLDLTADIRTGLPLIRESERECSGESGEEEGGGQGQGEGEGESGEEEGGGQGEGEWEGEEGEEEGGGQGQGEGEGESGEEEERQGEEGEGEEEGEEEEEQEGWEEEEREGWEERLIQDDTDREESRGMGTIREAEEEEDGEGEEVRRKGTDREEGWQERYVGEEGEEPEITPAPPEPIEDDLRASNNSLNLTSPDLSQGAEPVSPQDTQNLIYATVPESHRAKKRIKKLKDAQKQEMKARKDKRKMEERAERERRKMAAKERKAREKERKRQIQEGKLREDVGLGNVVRMHNIDTSTKSGKAQAQFIDAATAAIF